MNSATNYIKTADALFSKLIRSRGRCERCGTYESSTFQCAHVIGRDNKMLRWHAFNALCLCDSCHRWAHANPKLFLEFFENNFPDRFKVVMSLRNEDWHLKWYDYEELIKTLKEHCERVRHTTLMGQISTVTSPRR